MTDHDNCPKCKVSFIGDPIPEDQLKYFSVTHWSRQIGIDGGMAGIYDGIVAWKCPDCGHTFHRDDSKWALALFEKYKSLGEEK